MATANVNLVSSIRKAAAKISGSSAYQWGHMGLCNCGFLAQELTGMKKDDIHRRAMERSGDWSEQLNDYCPQSGLAMDDLIDRMLSYGLSREDLKHLERLSDARVLRRIHPERHLKHNVKGDVILYLHTWADLLEEELLKEIQLPALSSPLVVDIGIEHNP